MRASLNTRILFLVLADVLIVFVSMFFATALYLGIDEAILRWDQSYEWQKASVAAVVCLISLYIYDLYDYTVISNQRELLLRVIQAIGLTSIVLSVAFYFFPKLLIGRGIAIYSIVSTLIFVLAFRTWIHYLLGHPDLGEKILVVGDAPILRETMDAALERSDAGYRIVGYLSRERYNGEMSGYDAKRFGSPDELEEVLRNEKIDRIVIGVKERRGAFPTDVLLRLRLAGNVCIEESTSFFERVTGRVHLDMLHPSWLIYSVRPRDTQLKTTARETFYRILAGVGLLLSLPIAIVTAILIKLESGGSCFYKQERVGRNGRVFQLIKFRSMCRDAEIDGEPIWAATDDDRTTRVGRVIRKMRIDEIPQFWNILKGEMSFIGPRPERPHFVSVLSEQIPFYEHRHLVAPGLTGWAQINFPYGASVADAREKLQYDLYYIKNQTTALDILIMAETVKTVLFGRGGR